MRSSPSPRLLLAKGSIGLRQFRAKEKWGYLHRGCDGKTKNEGQWTCLRKFDAVNLHIQPRMSPSKTLAPSFLRGNFRQTGMLSCVFIEEKVRH